MITALDIAVPIGNLKKVATCHYIRTMTQWKTIIPTRLVDIQELNVAI